VSLKNLDGDIPTIFFIENDDDAPAAQRRIVDAIVTSVVEWHHRGSSATPCGLASE
jgi:hypothetical protein